MSCFNCKTSTSKLTLSENKLFCSNQCYFQAICAPKRSREEFAEENAKGIITINVGGKKFTTLKSTLQKYENSILYLLVAQNDRIPFVTDADGLPFLDMEPESFSSILNWLRSGKKQKIVDLEAELKYLNLWDEYNAGDAARTVIYIFHTYSATLWGPKNGRLPDEWLLYEKSNNLKFTGSSHKAAAILNWIMDKPGSVLLKISGDTLYTVSVQEPID